MSLPVDRTKSSLPGVKASTEELQNECSNAPQDRELHNVIPNYDAISKILDNVQDVMRGLRGMSCGVLRGHGRRGHFV